MQNSIVRLNQSVFDIALENAGTIEGVFDLVIANRAKLAQSFVNESLNSLVNQNLTLPEDMPKNSFVLKFYEKENIKIATI